MKKKIIALSLILFILFPIQIHGDMNELEVISNRTNMLLNNILDCKNKESNEELITDINYIRENIKSSKVTNNQKYAGLKEEDSKHIDRIQTLTALNMYETALENVNFYLKTNNKQFLKDAISINNFADLIKDRSLNE